MLHTIWNCDNICEGWVHSFAEVRSKFTCIEAMGDLVSIIKAKGKSLEEFAMIVWLI